MGVKHGVYLKKKKVILKIEKWYVHNIFIINFI